MITRCQMQGPRRYQEDRYAVLRKKGWDVLAVMDGHGGAECANKALVELSRINRRHRATDPGPGPYVRDVAGFLAQHCADEESGCTLSLVVIAGETAHVAVIGDSPVYIWTHDGWWKAPEHNVRSNVREAEACRARGAHVNGSYVLNQRSQGLQLSRALGDVDFKGLISSEAEFFEVRLDLDSIVIVASDGAFDPTHAGPSSNPPLMIGTSFITARKLLKLASGPDGQGLQDNATAIVWRARQ
jgi:serine/threonine protein phosphatase PrpC